MDIHWVAFRTYRARLDVNIVPHGVTQYRGE